MRRARSFDLFSSSDEQGFFIAPEKTQSPRKTRNENYANEYWIHEGTQVPRMRTGISARRHPCLRIRLRAARSRLRLRSHKKEPWPSHYRFAPTKHVALPRTASSRLRTHRWIPGRLHAPREGGSFGKSAGRARALGQKRYG